MKLQPVLQALTPGAAASISCFTSSCPQNSSEELGSFSLHCRTARNPSCLITPYFIQLSGELRKGDEFPSLVTITDKQ